jgi:hypothetical protein
MAAKFIVDHREAHAKPNTRHEGLAEVPVTALRVVVPYGATGGEMR